MAKTQTTSQTTSARRSEQRQLFTLEYATALCPHQTLADNLSRTFGLEPVDRAVIREAIEEHTVRSANALVDNLNEKAMQIHLQRVVAAFVGSACGAGLFVSIRGAPPTRDPSGTLRCWLRWTLRCVDGWGGGAHGREHRCGAERRCGRACDIISARDRRGVPSGSRCRQR